MLTEQKKRLVEEYLKLRCKNQGQAAVNAGYSPKSAQTQACQILKEAEVQDYLNQRKSELALELQQEFIFDALEAKKVLLEILKDEDASNRDRIAVARDFLDRAGFKAQENVNLAGSVAVKNPYNELTAEELRALAAQCGTHGEA